MADGDSGTQITRKSLDIIEQEIVSHVRSQISEVSFMRELSLGPQHGLKKEEIT
jgi:hypothetical protein